MLLSMTKTSSSALLTVLASLVLSSSGYRTSQGFKNSRYVNRQCLAKAATAAEGDADNFDGKEFEDVMRKVGGMNIEGVMTPDKDLMDDIRTQQAEKAEELFRSYPFGDNDLPVLPDCDNYYSGKFGDYIWHQNADQVYVYIPVSEDIAKYDVDAEFNALSVKLNIKGQEVVEFNTLERIIPDGSFWVMEEDKDGNKFVQLDMEKRFRMINWKQLFGDEPAGEPADITEKRSKMLEKLLAANKGLSKVSGVPAESMEDMMANGDLVKMMSDQIYGEPQVSTEWAEPGVDEVPEGAEPTVFDPPGVGGSDGDVRPDFDGWSNMDEEDTSGFIDVDGEVSDVSDEEQGTETKQDTKQDAKQKGVDLQLEF